MDVNKPSVLLTMADMMQDKETMGHVAGAIALAALTIGFCLEPETKPVFLEWVKTQNDDFNPEMWTDEKLRLFHDQFLGLVRFFAAMGMADKV